MPQPLARRATRGAAVVLVAGALAVAGCGPSGTSSAQPTAPAAMATAIPTISVPQASVAPAFSFAPPSLHADPALEALLPDDIAGQPMKTSSMRGAAIIGTGKSGDDLRAVLEQFGKSQDDLSVAFGAAANVSISAYRIKGIDAGKTYVAFLALVDLEAVPTITDVVVGGKSVKKLVASTATAYVYTFDDVIFTIAPPPEGGAAADAVVADGISKLP
jgi:hypothetical protein